MWNMPFVIRRARNDMDAELLSQDIHATELYGQEIFRSTNASYQMMMSQEYVFNLSHNIAV